MKTADMLIGVVIISLLLLSAGVLYQRLAIAVYEETPTTLHPQAQVALDNPVVAAPQDPSPEDLTALGNMPDVSNPSVDMRTIAIVECEWGAPYYHRGDHIESHIVARNVGNATVNTADVIIVAEQLVVTNNVPSIEWRQVAGTTYHYENLDLAPYSDYRQNVSFTVPYDHDGQSVVGTYRLNVTMYVNGDQSDYACALTKELNIL